MPFPDSLSQWDMKVRGAEKAVPLASPAAMASTRMRRWMAFLAFGLILPCLPAERIVLGDEQSDAASTAKPLDAATAAKLDKAFPLGKWVRVFDGKSLTGWRKTNFGGEGEVQVKDGQLILDFGASMTGVTHDGKTPLPTCDYEVRLEAKRIDGSDFFCGLTVPYKDSHFSYILGGWGGGLVGISSIDGNDAANNETATFHTFKDGQWYRIRLRVTDDHIAAWIDDRQVVDCDIGGRKITTRSESDLSRPFGFSTYDTRGALKNIEIRRLPAQQDDAAPASAGNEQK